MLLIGCNSGGTSKEFFEQATVVSETVPLRTDAEGGYSGVINGVNVIGRLLNPDGSGIPGLPLIFNTEGGTTTLQINPLGSFHTRRFPTQTIAIDQATLATGDLGLRFLTPQLGVVAPLEARQLSAAGEFPAGVACSTAISTEDKTLFTEAVVNMEQTARWDMNISCLTQHLQTRLHVLSQMALLPQTGLLTTALNDLFAGGSVFAGILSEARGRDQQVMDPPSFRFQGQIRPIVTDFLRGQSAADIENLVENGAELTAFLYDATSNTWDNVSGVEVYQNNGAGWSGVGTTSGNCLASLAEMSGNHAVCTTDFLAEWPSAIVFAIRSPNVVSGLQVQVVQAGDSAAVPNATVIVNGQLPQLANAQGTTTAFSLAAPTSGVINITAVAQGHRAQSINVAASNASNSTQTITLPAIDTTTVVLQGQVNDAQSQPTNGTSVALQLPTLLSQHLVTASSETGFAVGYSDDATYTWSYRSITDGALQPFVREDLVGKQEQHHLQPAEMLSVFNAAGTYELQVDITRSKTVGGAVQTYTESFPGVLVHVTAENQQFEPGDLVCQNLQSTEADPTPPTALQVSEIEVATPFSPFMISAQTDDTGAFQFTGFDATACPFLSYHVAQNGVNTIEKIWQGLTTCDNAVAASLTPAVLGEVTGVLRDAGTSAPIAGAVVELRHPLSITDDSGTALPKAFPAGNALAITDGQGAYQFSNVPDGAYQVFADSPSSLANFYLFSESDPLTVSEGNSVQQDLVLEPRNTVTISNIQAPFLGNVSIDVPQGEQFGVFRATAYQSINFDDHAFSQLLNAEGTIYLTINDVRISQAFSENGTVEVTFPLNPGLNRVQVHLETDNGVYHTPTHYIETRVDRGSVFGQLVDANDASTLDGAEVTVRAAGFLTSVQTAADGIFQIDNIPSPGDIELMITHAGHQSSQQVLYLQTGHQEDLSSVALPPTALTFETPPVITASYEQQALSFQTNVLNNGLGEAVITNYDGAEVVVRVENVLGAGGILRFSHPVSVGATDPIDLRGEAGVPFFLPAGVNLVQLQAANSAGFQSSSVTAVTVSQRAGTSVRLTGTPSRDAVQLQLQFTGITDYTNVALYLWHNGTWIDRSDALDNVLQNQLGLTVPVSSRGDQEIQAFLGFPDTTGAFTEVAQSERILVQPTDLVPRVSASSIEFSDQDSDSGQISGTITIGRAILEDSISHYTLALGALEASDNEENPTEGEFNVLCVLDQFATGETSLTYTLPDNSVIDSKATHFLVSTSNANGEHTTLTSLELLDKGLGLPTERAQSVSFSDTNTQQDVLQGTIRIVRAVDESEVAAYILYWGASNTDKVEYVQTDKLTADPIDFVPKTGNTIEYTLPRTTRPTGATHILVFTFNAVGEMETGIGTAIVDL